MFVEPNIESVEVVNFKRGGKIIITLKDDTFKPFIVFKTKKELKNYYDWITCNPNHPSHSFDNPFNN